uniref:Transcriptional regulator, LacI family n=1 Tax=uncultured Nocardioidaceae bacterium TaxID=253824 RepID=A0A6J4MJ91_9ACTN|nr:MAG: Transcriptional regulator, LacI family [uncultured Nocardioidaceae bacterium]
MTDVALLAGVSHQTVSRVLNAHPHVSPKTRLRVLDAMERLDYRPNSAARTLATGRSRTLGLLISSGPSFASTSALRGVQAAVGTTGYGAIVMNLPTTSTEPLREGMKHLLRQGVDGVIVVAPPLGSMRAVLDTAGRLPLVAVEAERQEGLSVVGADQVAVGRLATEHLLAAGHACVWHITGRKESYEAAGRQLGWQQALSAVGIAAPPPLTGDGTSRSGYQAGHALVSTPGATAVFAGNDRIALGLLRALAEYGRRVPEDVSIVGADDVPESAYFSPPLSTVRQDFDEVGRQSVACVLAQLGVGPPAADLFAVQPELVGRLSVYRRRASC